MPGTGDRLWRSGAMAREMARDGHTVTWWMSDFDHVQKRNIPQATVRAAMPEGVRPRFLSCRGYGQNMSLARIRSHQDMARSFSTQASAEERPDLIVCSFPPAELCRAASAYASHNGIPFFVDVRDLWPDVWQESNVENPLKRIALRAGVPWYRGLTQRALRSATGFLAPSPDFVTWGTATQGRPPGPKDRVIPLGYPEWDRLPEDQLRRTIASFDMANPDAPLRILFLGTLGAQFTLDPVISAMASFEPSEAQLVLAGDGSDRERLISLTKHLDHVHLPGWTRGDETTALLQWANIGLAPYNDTAHWRAHIANKPYEYLSGGLAVLSGVQGALSRLIDELDCGATYEPGRPETLTRILRRYLTEPQYLVRQGHNAERAFRERFSARHVYGGLASTLIPSAHA